MHLKDYKQGSQNEALTATLWKKKKKKKDIWNYHEFPHSAGDNFDALILLAFLLSTVINPF